MVTFRTRLYENAPEILYEVSWTNHRKLTDYTKLHRGRPLRGVYKLYRNGRLNTVGQSHNLRNRLKAHLANIRRYNWGSAGGWTYQIYLMPGSTKTQRKQQETRIIKRNCPQIPHQCARHREQEFDLLW